MYDFVINLTAVLGFFTLLGHIAIGFFLVLFLFKSRLVRLLFTFVKRNILWLGFGISLVAMLMSLFYSEVAGFAPCELCWWQRIIIYPLVILFGVALKRNDKKICDYTLPLVAIGVFIAAYHYTIQMISTYGPDIELLVPCGSGEGAVPCTEFYFMEYGYITMPMMSLTALSILLIAHLINKYAKA